MTENQNRILKLVMVGILMVSMFVLAREGAVYVTSLQVENKSRACVVIDAGHGGSDPGKVGINNQLEKEINLKIAEILKDFLQAEGIEVVMTRESDAGLYDEGASNKKVQDMKRRLEIIEKADPVIVVSIHQNSYHEEYVKGAQVFYYTHSTDGERAAGIMQKALLAVDQENHRQEKADDGYYLLRRTEVPTIIVECGFLSNREEAEKLVDEKYQKKIAKAVVQGIEEFVGSREK